jgi:hypothetical protein
MCPVNSRRRPATAGADPDRRGERLLGLLSFGYRHDAARKAL